MKPLALSGRKGWASRLACTCVAHSVCMGGKNAEREREGEREREREGEGEDEKVDEEMARGATRSGVCIA